MEIGNHLTLLGPLNTREVSQARCQAVDKANQEDQRQVDITNLTVKEQTSLDQLTILGLDQLLQSNILHDPKERERS